MSNYVITVVDTLKIKGQPSGWMPSATKLIEVGVPVRIAQRWQRERHQMTRGLRRRVKQDLN